MLLCVHQGARSGSAGEPQVAAAVRHDGCMLNDLNEMIGGRILVGVTYLNDDGGVHQQVQFVGRVTEVEPLVSIEREGFEPFHQLKCPLLLSSVRQVTIALSVLIGAGLVVSAMGGPIEVNRLLALALLGVGVAATVVLSFLQR